MEREQAKKHINDLYGLYGDVAIDCLWTMLEELQLDAFSDEALARLAEIQISADKMNAEVSS